MWPSPAIWKPRRYPCRRRIEGDIRCASLIQGDGGRIAGGIVADQTRIAGLVDGSIATRELFLSRTARVTGDIAMRV
jgi:cytoskeletal protein CcmA (bactofilin family)